MRNRDALNALPQSITICTLFNLYIHTSYPFKFSLKQHHTDRGHSANVCACVPPITVIIFVSVFVVNLPSPVTSACRALSESDTHITVVLGATSSCWAMCSTRPSKKVHHASPGFEVDLTVRPDTLAHSALAFEIGHGLISQSALASVAV